MPLENSLNLSPYFDDYDEAKEFYRVLFKPGVAVQTRELNQLQSIIQNQIERFGNHVFKSGTIVSGINFSYLPSYDYVKITDTQVDGQSSLPSSYVGYFVRSNLNLIARVVNYQDGIESKAPDLKTLYLQYVNSSDEDVSNSNVRYTSFAPGQQLTVFSKSNELFQVNVNNGGQGFSNADTVVVTSSITVSGNTVAFSNGETLTQSTTGARVVVASINTTAIPNTVILKVKPRTVDLTNNSVNSTSWSLSTGYNIIGGTSGATANVVSLIGSGASGLITTDTQGIVQTITLASGGNDYEYLPFVTIKTANTTATVNNLDLIPQNYKTVITVANSSVNAVGTGYAFGVSEGIIYQKGFFLKVDPQVIIVDKYTITPNNVAVGFKSVETFVDSNVDESLYDNATGTTNYTAPGADRLRLVPTLMLTTLDEAASNVDFFALAEWKEGFPYKENRVTIYSNLAEEAARRTREAQGNFVVDSFQVTTREKVSNTTHYDVVIDPGLGYIDGYRVSTNFNNYLPVQRATQTESFNAQTISINYGNYVLVKELAGQFNFKVGASISLRSAAKTYITSGTVGTSTAITPAGSEIGTARMRSLVLNNGEPGTAGCTYRLYLFDISMNAGFSFREVRSVYYDSVVDGVADISLTYDATTSANVAILVDQGLDKMLFGIGQQGVKTVTNFVYDYRTSSDSTLQLTSAGQLTIGPLGSGLTFPYGDGVLSATQKKDFLVLPLANTQASANIAGSVTVNSGNAVIVGSSTTFASDVKVGDFVKFANSSASVVGQVTSVANNTYLTLQSAPGSSIAGANGVLFYPAMYPLSLENRTDRTVTISASSKTTTLNINKTLASTVNAIAVFNTRKSGSPVTKTINRNVFVKLHTSNNVASNTGPWILGVPGAVRLKNVYLGNSSTVNTSSTDVTKHFFIDSGDDEGAYRSSQLVKALGSTLSISNNQFILVKFDAFTTGGAEGFFSIGSYSINDTANLASSTSTINTLELPETVTKSGRYFDARDTIDFRPYGSNTAALATSEGSANVNPANTFTLSGDDQFFPVPDSTATFDYEIYLPRIDRVTVNKNSEFIVTQGTAARSPRAPKTPVGAVTLSLVSVPRYPSLARSLNGNTLEFADKQIGGPSGILDRRVRGYTVKTSQGRDRRSSQPKRYTMASIGALDRRITNLEHISSLNAAEQSIKDKVIPSSITPSTSRFKNAFFIDGFDDYSKSSLMHNEFAAVIDQSKSRLRPQTKQLNFESQFDRTDATTLNAIVNDSTLMLPYTEEVLINQSIKSEVVKPLSQRTQYVGEVVIYPISTAIAAVQEVVQVARSEPIVPVIINSDPGVPPVTSLTDIGSDSSGSDGVGVGSDSADGADG
jgi:hypothetical protein